MVADVHVVLLYQLPGVQWHNKEGLAEMSPLDSKKLPPVAHLAHELTKSKL